jgi:hypothetical protein
MVLPRTASTGLYGSINAGAKIDRTDRPSGLRETSRLVPKRYHGLCRMHFRVWLETERFVKMVPMRSFPLVVVVWLLCWLAPVSAWASTPIQPAITASVRSDRQIQFLLHQTHEHWGTKRLMSFPNRNRDALSHSAILPVTIPPGASILLPVIFTPTAKGYTDGILTVASSALNSLLYMHVAGTGVYPAGP